MPPFGWRMNDQEIADVVNFIRTSWGQPGAKRHVAKRSGACEDTAARRRWATFCRRDRPWRIAAERQACHSSPSPARGRGLPYQARPPLHSSPNRTCRPSSSNNATTEATPGSPDGSAATGAGAALRGRRPVPAGRRRRVAGRQGRRQAEASGSSRRPPARRCSGRPAAPRDRVDDAIHARVVGEAHENEGYTNPGQGHGGD